MSQKVKTSQKTVSGNIDNTNRELVSFVAEILRGPLEQAAGIIEDKLQYVRLERQVRLRERFETFLHERGLSSPTRVVPLKIAIPLLEAASIEDDDDLQDLWASLLANAADANSGIDIRRVYISILQDIGTLEALILQKIYALPEEKQFEDIWTTFLPDKIVLTRPELDNLLPPYNVELALGNLVRLGCLTAHTTMNGIMILSCVNQTALGRAFVQACTSCSTVACSKSE